MIERPGSIAIDGTGMSSAAHSDATTLAKSAAICSIGVTASASV